ncbi:MAG: dienelactone hydrolase family protein [Gammaproteobacteria bacterium]|nr:dienelactone hydrolase family protein [Gammaproteobacteria bacterium]
MKQQLLRVLIFVSCFIWTAAQAALQTEDVTYEANGTQMKGYLAYDDSAKGKRPGVLVVHEWWGHNEHARNRAEALAKMGYTALALDMYGGGKQAHHPDDAGKFSGEVKKNMDVAQARFDAALKLLQKHSTTDPERIAAIGYCFGGAIVLEMARRGVDLDAVASFHGSLGTNSPAQKGKIKAKILVANGADDPFVPKEQIAAFKKEMDQAGVDYRFISYPGAKHSFTNPGADANGKKFNLPLAYNKKADKASWKEMSKLFKRVFAKP